MNRIDLETNLRALEDFKTMEQNWNLHGASAFSASLIDRCADLLKRLPVQPKIFPTAKNSIQFEYEKPNGDYLEFEIYEDRIAAFSVFGQNETEADIPDRGENIASHVVRFMNNQPPFQE